MSDDEENPQIFDEESPFNLQGVTPEWPRGVKLQLGLVLAMQLADPLNGQSIGPYINQLIMELSVTQGDPKKVRYYAGLIVRHQIYTALRILILSSRCICEFFNGNVGAMKSVMGNLTSPCNRATAFSWIPSIWVSGPIIGGTLSRPQDRWPGAFSNPFWKKYPYFLPPLIIGSYAFVVWVCVLLFFRESNPKIIKSIDRDESTPTSYGTVLATTTVEEKPPPLRDLLTYRVVITIANYTSLAFLEIMILAFIPLFCSLPTEVGGLGLSPAAIGFIFAGYGLTTGVLQILFFPKSIVFFGIKKLFVWGLCGFIPMCFLFPAMSLWARAYGVTADIWTMCTIVVLGLCAQDFAYGAISVYIATAVHSKKSLGATNGLAQMMVLIIHSIGPAFIASLYLVSLEPHILDGNAVHMFLIIVCCLALTLSSRLLEKVWDEVDTNDSRSHYKIETIGTFRNSIHVEDV